LGSADAVKRHSKNDFMRHLTPRMIRSIHHGNLAIIPEMGPMIVVGSGKAQSLKAKPIDGSEPPRARDEVTQKMANILVHPMPH
jgi:hypothetical protein